MAYDIIGDIHGHHDELLRLLEKLGYQSSDGVWRHPERQAIFVGDFIDRGPGQLKTLDTVRRMVDAGSAQALMGNHEFNALAWYTEHPTRPGEHLRPRNDKNRRQHEAFLDEIADRPTEYESWMKWFYTLPLWLELRGLRIVHACWHPDSMDTLQPRLAPGNRLTPKLLVTASNHGHADFHAVETVLKGLEVPLPEGVTFEDKGGHLRHRARVRWWDPDALTYRKAGVTGTGYDEHPDLPEEPLPPAASYKYRDDTPVFFGHYWMHGDPKVQTPRAACVDYSVAKGGPLVAYRWSGEATLSDSNFVSGGD